jgi:pilus assembly protein CpaE
MANFMTVSLECQTEEVRATFKAAFASHREFVPKPTRVSGMPDMLVLELDDYNPTRTLREVRNIVETAPRTDIVLTSKRTDPQIMLEAMRMGVKEFLPQPLQAKEVEEALIRFKTRFASRNQSAEANLGAVITVLGGKAGMGTSTVALNLAMALHKSGKATQHAVLVDLNLTANDLPLYLDVAAQRGWHDVSQDISRLDPAMLQGVLVRHESGLHLLGAGGEGLEEVLAPGCVLYTVDLLRSLFDYVVVDCGSRVTPAVEESLELSNHVYVVTCLSVPSIRHAKRMTQILQERVGHSTPIDIVVNRYRSRDVELLRQAEGVLHTKASWLIPNDYGTVSQSLDGGTPLLQAFPRAEVTHNYAKHAAGLVKEWTHRKKGPHPSKQIEKEDSLLGRLWSGVASSVRVKTGLA